MTPSIHWLTEHSPITFTDPPSPTYGLLSLAQLTLSSFEKYKNQNIFSWKFSLSISQIFNLQEFLVIVKLCHFMTCITNWCLAPVKNAFLPVGEEIWIWAVWRWFAWARAIATTARFFGEIKVLDPFAPSTHSRTVTCWQLQAWTSPVTRVTSVHFEEIVVHLKS